MRHSGGTAIAAGLLIQHFPDGEEGRERLHAKDDNPEWEHVAALAGSIRHEELVDQDLSLEEIVWRLFHEEPEVRVDPQSPLTRGCRCTVEHYRKVLVQFPAEELAEMRDPSGIIPVDCAFCSRVLEVDV